ncbi:hypothetical protein [Dyella humicola]|uniref:hypothetical protein n=1 Tax=Dyella humicola TaxID=2992126 RepID=UPI0022562501|nr:hypothetical protein [Dyella humicola]
MGDKLAPRIAKSMILGLVIYATMIVLVMIIVFLKCMASGVPYGMVSFVAALKSVSRGAIGIGVATAGLAYFTSNRGPGK